MLNASEVESVRVELVRSDKQNNRGREGTKDENTQTIIDLDSHIEGAFAAIRASLRSAHRNNMSDTELSEALALVAAARHKKQRGA